MTIQQISSTDIVSVANTAITGNIVSSQITSVANTQITGIIPVTSGGTGLTSFTAGQIHYGSFSTSANLFWDSANNRLGIGTSSPSTPLQITGTTAATNLYISTTTGASFGQFGNSGSTTYVGTDSSTGGTITGTGYASFIWGQNAYPLIFGVNNAERMRIDSSGNVLIGTTTSPLAGPAGTLIAQGIATKQGAYVASLSTGVAYPLFNTGSQKGVYWVTASLPAGNSTGIYSSIAIYINDGGVLSTAVVWNQTNFQLTISGTTVYGTQNSGVTQPKITWSYIYMPLGS